MSSSKNHNHYFLFNRLPIMWLSLMIALLFFWGNGCSSSNRNRTASPSLHPAPHVEEPSYIKRIQFNFQKGEELMMKGDVEGARYYFDRVIDLFFDSANDPSAPLFQAQLNDYIIRIAQIEQSYLKDKNNGDNNLEAHEAFLDEVIATPLFKPSKHEISQLQEQLEKQEPQYSIPVTVNSRVVSFIKAFQNIRHKNIQRALNRSSAYITEFKRIFRENGIPEDLAYLPIIESGFRVDAVSRSRARGTWQFMVSTAQLFGLRVDWIVDERLDPFKACAAAARYLKHLYQEYGDWYLALACYNGGTRRINRAINHLKTKDFFKIANSNYIRRETRNYVPAFLAALIIAKDPGTYGFTIEPPDEGNIFENTKTITIPSPVSLDDVCSLTNIPLNTLQKMNPELIREFTPFTLNYYNIRVPNHIDEQVLAGLKRIPPAKRSFVGWYQVRSGDSLYSIARKFKTSVNRLKQANKLNSNLIKPGKRLIIPRGG